MKNIHVLPTNKPSRLSKDENDRIWLSINFEYSINDNNKQNIYITSDEEIKEGDWCLDIKRNIIFQSKRSEIGTSKKIPIIICTYEGCYIQKDCKKIILTTDQDLIKDGVQAIDDEFLEWFVKNPSCEEVEVKKECCGQCDERLCEVYDLGIKELDYKIIIPKEEVVSEYDIMPNIVYGENVGERIKIKAKILSKKEQKQHLIDMMKTDEELGLYEENTKCYCGHTTYCDCGPEEPKQTDEKGKPMTYWGGLEKPKQQTLEEAAEFKSHHSEEDFIRGGRWQQERSYSEKEVLEILDHHTSYLETFIYQYIDRHDMEVNRDWFKQFKKK